MISLDPSQRPTFDSLLHTSRGNVFPESFFSFLHNYVSSINELPSTSPFAGLATPATPSTITGASPNPRLSQPTTHHGGSTASNEALPSDSDHRLERLWADFESVEPYITAEMADEPTMDIKIDYNSTVITSKPFQVCSVTSETP